MVTGSKSVVNARESVVKLSLRTSNCRMHSYYLLTSSCTRIHIPMDKGIVHEDTYLNGEANANKLDTRSRNEYWKHKKR